MSSYFAKTLSRMYAHILKLDCVFSVSLTRLAMGYLERLELMIGLRIEDEKCWYGLRN